MRKAKKMNKTLALSLSAMMVLSLFGNVPLSYALENDVNETTVEENQSEQQVDQKESDESVEEAQDENSVGEKETEEEKTEQVVEEENKEETVEEKENVKKEVKEVETEAKKVDASGTQKAYIVLEDWGPVVKKTVIHLDKTVVGITVGDEKDEVTVKETKPVLTPSWTIEKQTNKRTVLDVYTSDSEGNRSYRYDDNWNRVAGDSEYITIDMYVSPTMTGEGAAFVYNGYNEWCDPYQLEIELNGEMKDSNDNVINKLDVKSQLDLSSDRDRICPEINQFKSSSFKASDGKTLPYASYAPAKSNKKKALIIWLHGAGEGGTDPEVAYLGNKVTTLIGSSFQSKFTGGAHVLVPQCPTGYGWPVDADGNYTNGKTPSKWRTSLFELIENYVQTHSDVDTDRIIIGGCSNGGNMVYDLVLSHMGYFAAAFPMCHEFDINTCTEEQLDYLKTFPVWSTYTLGDSSSFKGSIPIVNKMKEIGATNFHYSEFKNAYEATGRYFGDPNDPEILDTTGTSKTPLQYDGHWAWTLFFENQCKEDGMTEWQWLAKQTKQNSQTVEFEPGYTLEKDENSPTGYMAHFVYDAKNDSRVTKEISSISLMGSFRLLSGDKPISEATDHSPFDYENGDFCANVHPRSRPESGIFGYTWSENMSYNYNTKMYEIDMPMLSGAHQYSYVITFEDSSTLTVDDPENPSPCRLNEKNSNTATGDVNNSIAYGKWDSVKQSRSPNLDFVNPDAKNKGKIQYIEYKGSLADDQDLGVYLPYNYDPSREEGYKVIYTSHGAGGNETYWFAMGQSNNAMDHIIESNPNQEAIIVNLDNALYNWDYEKIADNVINYVIPFMEANFNVSTDAQDRAFCGFSMGSMTTTYMAFHHADMFGYFGIFSGCNIGNATFKDGFEYDSSKFNTPEGGEYLKEVYENIEPSEDLLKSVVFTMAGDSDTAVFANGFGYYGAYETIRDWCAQYMPSDYFVDGGQVHGSHDLYTWAQCFNKFASEICWSKNVKAQEPVTPVDPAKPSEPNINENIKPIVPIDQKEENDKKVKTSDDTNTMMYASLMVFAVLGLSSAVIMKRKKAEN